MLTRTLTRRSFGKKLPAPTHSDLSTWETLERLRAQLIIARREGNTNEVSIIARQISRLEKLI